jgi:hypothetical protein
LIGLVSVFERQDGQTSELADVWFQVSASERLDERAAQLGGELKAYQLDRARDLGLPSLEGTSSGEAGLDPPSHTQAIAHALRSYGDRLPSGLEVTREGSGAVSLGISAPVKPQTAPVLGTADSGGLVSGLRGGSVGGGGGGGGAGDD